MTEGEFDLKLEEVIALLGDDFSDDCIAEIVDLLAQDYTKTKLRKQ